MNRLTKTLIALLILLPGLFLPPASQADEFDIFIVPTVDDKLDSWLKTTPYMQPTIYMVENIYPNQPFALRLLFKGFSLSKSKNAFITYDVQIFDPQGKPTEDKGENLLAYNGPVKSSNYIVINQQFLRIYFDETYPPGDYEILVTATDQSSKKTYSKREKVSLKPFKRLGNFSSFDFFRFWIKNYFQQPDPARAVFGILQFFRNDLDWLQKNLLLVNFAAQLLEENPWIWNHLYRHAGDSSEDRETIITLMALSKRQDAAFSRSFTPEEKAWYDKVHQLDLTSRQPTETLWGEFFVTGHLEPLEKIVRLLKPFTLPELAGEKLRRETAEEWAFWSLVEYGPDIPIVSIYCLHLLDRAQLDPQNRVQLRLALEVIQKTLDERAAESAAADKKTPLPLTR